MTAKFLLIAVLALPMCQAVEPRAKPSELANAAACPGAYQIARLLKHELMPAGFRISPERLSELWPYQLDTVADGSGPLLRQTGDTCDVLFGFVAAPRGSNLETVTVIVKGPKEALLDAAVALAEAVTFSISDEARSSLSRGQTLDFGTRIPPDPTMPGAVSTLTVELRKDRTWLLDFHYANRRDP